MAQPKWSEFILDDSGGLSYSTAPRTARALYFQKYILPNEKGDVEENWAKFNTAVDGIDAKVLTPGILEDVRQRVRNTRPQQQPKWNDFLKAAPQEYTTDQDMRDSVRAVYFENYILPTVSEWQVAETLKEFNAAIDKIDQKSGRITQPDRPSTLPSIQTGEDLTPLLSDRNLIERIAKRAATQTPITPEFAGDTGRAYLGAPDTNNMTEVVREELIETLKANGNADAEKLVKSDAGYEMVKQLRKNAMQAGAELARQGDATWTRLFSDLKNDVYRGTRDAMRNGMYTLATIGIVSSDTAEEYYQSQQKKMDELPPSLERGFWGEGVEDIAEMAPLLAAAGAASIPTAGYGGIGVFAGDQIGRGYRYAVKDIGLEENITTRVLATGFGLAHAAVEQMTMRTAAGATLEKGVLSQIVRRAMLKAAPNLAKKRALRVGTNLTLNTVEQMGQEAVQGAVEALHQELSQVRGGGEFDKKAILDAAKQGWNESKAASILLSAGLGGAGHINRNLSLKAEERRLNEDLVELDKAQERDKHLIEARIAERRTKIEGMRETLGLDQGDVPVMEDAPQTTEGGELPLKEDQQQEQQAEQAKPAEQKPGSTSGIGTVLVAEAGTKYEVVAATESGVQLRNVRNNSIRNFDGKTLDEVKKTLNLKVFDESAQPKKETSAQEKPPKYTPQQVREAEGSIKRQQARIVDIDAKIKKLRSDPHDQNFEQDLFDLQNQKKEAKDLVYKIRQEYGLDTTPVEIELAKDGYSETIRPRLVELGEKILTDGEGKQRGVTAWSRELKARVGEAAYKKLSGKVKGLYAEVAGKPEKVKTEKPKPTGPFIKSQEAVVEALEGFDIGDAAKGEIIGEIEERLERYGGDATKLTPNSRSTLLRGGKVGEAFAAAVEEVQLQHQAENDKDAGAPVFSGIDPIYLVKTLKPTARAAARALRAGQDALSGPVMELAIKLYDAGVTAPTRFRRALQALLGNAFKYLKGRVAELYRAVREDAGFAFLPPINRGKIPRNRLQKWVSYWFSGHRDLTQAIDQLRQQKEMITAAHMKAMEIRLGVFARALNSTYKENKGGRPTDADIHQINQVLANNATLDSLPEGIRAATGELRQFIDELTNEVMQSGQLPQPLMIAFRKNLGAYMTRSYRVFDDPKYRKKLVRTLQDLAAGNEVRVNPKLYEVIQRAHKYVGDKYRLPSEEEILAMNQQQLIKWGIRRNLFEFIDTVNGKHPKLEGWTNDKIAEALIEMEQELPDVEVYSNLLSVVKKAADSGDMMGFMQGSLLGQRDTKNLKKRQVIPEAIMDLMGVHKDPGVNFARSVMTLSNLIANHEFLTQAREIGLANGTFITPHEAKRNSINRPDPQNKKFIAAFTRQIPLGESMDPLAGLYTTEEIYQAFREAVTPQEMSRFGRIYMGMNALVKVGKVAYSPKTVFRNFWGNLNFMVQQGHWRFWKIGTGWKQASAAWSNKAQAEKTITRLVELGILGDNVNAGELQAMLKDAFNRQDGFEVTADTMLQRLTTGAGKVHRKVVDTYQLMDDIWKVFAYENELARYKSVAKKKGWTQDQLERHVADIVRNTYPTYSLQPRIIRLLRRLPFISSFPSFAFAVMRGAYKTGQIISKEIRDEDTRWIGVQRASGYIASTLGTYAILQAALASAGMSDEDEIAAREFLPYYEKNAMLLWLDNPWIDENGKRRARPRLRYVNLSYTHAGAPILDPIMAGLRGLKQGEILKAATTAAREFLDPFASQEILFGALRQGLEGETTTGRKIVNPVQTDDLRGITKSAAKTAEFLFKELEPGFISQGRDLVRGLNKQVTLYGKKYNLGEEAFSIIAGMEVATRDVQQAGAFRATRLHADFAEAGRVMSDEVSKTVVADAKIRQSVTDMEYERRQEYNKQRELYEQMIRLGLNRRQAMGALKAGGMSTTHTKDITRNVYRPYKVGDRFKHVLRSRLAIGPEGPAVLDHRTKLVERELRLLGRKRLGVLGPGTSIRR